jgi:methylated-DNA-[protein]-cysteine S-methyltransferase
MMELTFEDLHEYLFQTQGKRWQSTHASPVGTWQATWHRTAVTALRLHQAVGDAVLPTTQADAGNEADEEKVWCATLDQQLHEYFAGERRRIEVALEFSGTLFQEKVWIALLKIPYGKTVTYGELAAQIGCPSAIRAVATAVGRNPLPLLIPCHRVVAKSGIGGYLYGVVCKKHLLELEKHFLEKHVVR